MSKTYMLKTINADRTSYGSFVWPESGRVECADWDPTPECGGGLHGALMGKGDGSLFKWKSDAIWLVLEIDKETVVDLKGKVKVPYCEIVYSGDRKTATDMIVSFGGIGVIGVFLVGGHGSTLTGGDRSILTGGHGSILTGGNYSTLTGGNYSTLTGGDSSTLTGGDRSILTGGYRSTLTGGDRSILTGGDRSTLTGGDGSTVTGGFRSTLVGGDYSTVIGDEHSIVTGGTGSTVVGGDKSVLIVKYICSNSGITRYIIGYVGENGIEPNVPYVVVDERLVKKECE